MPDVTIGHLDEPRSLLGFWREFGERHPSLCFDRFEVEGTETVLRAECGGTRVCWVYAGDGEVWLPRGTRTKEGDGAPLPAEYAVEPAPPRLLAALDQIAGGLHSCTAGAVPALQAILSRRKGPVYTGDYANDLWKLEHTARPWSAEPEVEAAIESLFGLCMESGHSVKQVDSYERVMAGDQLCVAGDEELRVRGRFSCLTLEHTERRARHVPPAMRLRHLRDSSGGCNFDFDPFRRLPLTWYMGSSGESGDGVNFVNSHVVNIAKETSPTHFHPFTARGGGLPQHEMYLVLDPAAYGLNTYGREASIVVYPDLMDLRRFERHALRPGTLLYIPPGTGHRGMDVFVNVLTVPGFKPHNEFYIDRDIRDATQGAAPCNESLFDIRNYTTIEDVVQ